MAVKAESWGARIGREKEAAGPRPVSGCSLPPQVLQRTRGDGVGTLNEGPALGRARAEFSSR